MTTIPPVGTQSETTEAPKATGPGVDYQAFLKLLVAEMKNQDPTEPMDATQQISQLAQFSSVEQAVQTNKKLDQLLASSSLSQADGIIGRTVTSADGTVSGIVESVQIYSDGMIATLKGGAKLPIMAGIVVS
ncbi:flagellar hook assembly protein FlgD [Phyllobacterium endophyticum]|jgi:flagellar basal-body rod modification protein FlgD|uniref:Basal-body rod modification protein FlgD n=1 Tax=Phyllobacterium endophyticum TaxID=1149773 RepID=A0A2P7AP18_9HYPH|nr:flagellar hook assembly protein FlgD [Phyllobacterium endophyticum]MBB3233700.1 flagellar basal-body rod modification protein FlgD [Phyllobacterium endophyticum]PSH55954.1 flagellar basal body rod modification protein [Phyllobacterium endophyticum]TXR47189.1 flagellar hook assembly protein FlgD [Phyllobacterium endophyticum]TYR41098.1 flagellar hook assembly protein FlgD [Phyllobacterium endophyticum]